MSIESVMPSNHLILYHPLLLLSSIFPSIRVFSNESVLASSGQSIGASASASVLPVNIQGWSPLGMIGLISLQSRGLSRVLSNTTVQKHQFFGVQLSLWSDSCIHTWPLEKLQFKTSCHPRALGKHMSDREGGVLAGLAWKLSLHFTCSGGKCSFSLVIEQTWLRPESIRPSLPEAVSPAQMWAFSPSRQPLCVKEVAGTTILPFSLWSLPRVKHPWKV